MCGICGIAAAVDAAATVAAMSAAMVHRGPDDNGVYFDPRSMVALAARRLSIIDPPGGHQPLANEDGTIWAVLNGEIYNYRALRQRLARRGHRLATESDTEVLVHLYEEFGSDLVHALEGMFAFALWDEKRRELVLARDRFGEKPLFYSERYGSLVFASELKALLRAHRDAELDPAAVSSFFTFGYVIGPGSIVSGVSQLPPGHVLLWSPERGVQSRRYWSPAPMPSGNGGPIRELVAETRRLLEESITTRLVADVPVGVFLSGGLDSTLITLLAARHVRDLETFTVGYDHGTVNELRAARRVAALAGSTHQELVLRRELIPTLVPSLLERLDQPLADDALIPLAALAEFARGKIKVAVGGEGADELFGGYPRYWWLARASRLPEWLPRRIPIALLKHAGTSKASRMRDVLDPASSLDRHVGWVSARRVGMRSAVFGERLRAYVNDDPFAAALPYAGSNGDIEGQFMHLDQSYWLPDDVLAKADRASMLASLELRTPYLHRELAELACSIPAATHVRAGGKFLLREVLRELSSSAPYRRAKVAFRAPVEHWFRGPLVPIFERQLRSSALYEQGWFDRRTVSALLRAHRQGRADWSRLLWPILVLGCWIDGHDASGAS
jgi:asparagine synthase (glutamine-hydrolysing)